MVLESDQQPVKRGRGRPRKDATTTPSTPKVAPKKHVAKSHAHEAGMTWEEELAAFERRSNKSGVLTLLVLLLWIALIGYGMYLKLHQSDSDDAGQTTLKTTVKTTQNNSGSTTEQREEQTAPTENTVPAGQEATLITEYFSRVSNGQTNDLATLEDTSFRNVATLRNYFGKDRLATFAKNTVNGVRVENMTPVTDDPVFQRNATAKAFDFMTVYTLKSDEKEYRDSWRWYTVQKGSGTVINGFLYQGTGVSQSPFFQFSKFGIK